MNSYKDFHGLYIAQNVFGGAGKGVGSDAVSRMLAIGTLVHSSRIQVCKVRLSRIATVYADSGFSPIGCWWDFFPCGATEAR